MALIFIASIFYQLENNVYVIKYTEFKCNSLNFAKCIYLTTCVTYNPITI